MKVMTLFGYEVVSALSSTGEIQRTIIQHAIKRVAVIGAGVSGITAAKGLLEEGIEPVVFEQGPQIGGVWTFDETLPDGGGPAYRSLRTNTPKRPTAFSDFPFADDLPDYPTRVDITQYLNAYADHFHVREHIRFSTRVEAVEPADENCWRVTMAGGEVAVFDAVFVCSGVFHSPVLPYIPGAETFTGTMMHSRGYTGPEALAGKRVVVIGAASSGTDVAIETSQVAEQLWLSVRGNTWNTALKPVASPRFKLIRDRLRLAKTRLVRRLVLALGLQQPAPARPDAPFARIEPPIILKDKLRERIAAGAVCLKPTITRITGDTILFEDGTHVQADVIICATGYTVKFPFLSPQIVSTDMAGLPLYRLVFAPDWPTLAFGGMFRLTGAVFPLSEMQARWAARVWRGTAHLPSPVTMWGAIRARQTTIVRRGSNPSRLEFEPYMDLLAAELGILPRLWRRPTLLWALLFGPSIAAQYRLDGPGRWAGAAQTIRAAARKPHLTPVPTTPDNPTSAPAS